MSVIPPAIERSDDLGRIEEGLRAAKELLLNDVQMPTATELKPCGDVVTAADRAVNHLLSAILPRVHDGWLSEESADNGSRLERPRVWIVDPIDGTKEFISGVPEWCISIGLVENGAPVAGGVCNPSTGELVIGSRETGLWSCVTAAPGAPQRRPRPLVLASRSEVARGEWEFLQDSSFDIRCVGSIAYKLALVAAGVADATWTLTPKHNWDVAGGIALVLASGGTVRRPQGGPILFNRPDTRWEGLLAFSASAGSSYIEFFEERLGDRIAKNAGYLRADDWKQQKHVSENTSTAT